MKPSKRQDAPGPERGQGGKRTGGDQSAAESRPEEIGADAAQRERLEKEREIQEGKESGRGEEGGESGSGQEAGESGEADAGP